MTTSASVILQIFHSFRMHVVTDSLNPASILSLRVVNPPPPYIQQLVDVEKSYLFNIHYRDSVAVNLMNSEWCTIALTSPWNASVSTVLSPLYKIGIILAD